MIFVPFVVRLGRLATVMEYGNHLELLCRDHPVLAAELGDSDALENVLGWMNRRGFPAGTVDLVPQDEFSYDFLIHLEEQRWLAFGVN